MTLSPQSAPSAWRLIRFAAIAVPIYAAAQPVVAYLPAIMAKDFGLSLGTLGLLMLAGQIINSVLDPVIGTLSDHTRARFGRRRTWIAAGGLTFTAGAVLLFFPAARRQHRLARNRPAPVLCRHIRRTDTIARVVGRTQQRLSSAHADHRLHHRSGRGGAGGDAGRRRRGRPPVPGRRTDAAGAVRRARSRHRPARPVADADRRTGSPGGAGGAGAVFAAHDAGRGVRK
ncbi:MFS transporter [Novosphingobium sp. NBM11]|nr:MFS transporter [Novosphingobium sp. NBM11]